MIICMFLMVSVVVALTLGMWQDVKRHIDNAIRDLEDELRFSPDHAPQLDVDDDIDFNLSFDVEITDYDD